MSAPEKAWDDDLLRDPHAVADKRSRVQRMFAYDSTAAWVTTDGRVVFALAQPEAAPQAIGTLPAAPRADHHLTLVGAWTAITATELGRTVTLDSGDGDGDECGGSADYRLTLAPPGTAPGQRVGVTWFGGWSRPFCG